MSLDEFKNIYGLVNRSFETVGLCLEQAVEIIDEQFDSGYARKHPELIGCVVRAISANIETTIQAKTAQEQKEWLAAAVYDAAKAIRLLGNGNIDRGDYAPGAIEDLAITLKKLGKDVVSAIGSLDNTLLDMMPVPVDDSAWQKDNEKSQA